MSELKITIKPVKKHCLTCAYAAISETEEPCKSCFANYTPAKPVAEWQPDGRFHKCPHCGEPINPAAMLGRNKKKVTPASIEARRANGKLGGRPRKVKPDPGEGNPA